MTSSPKDIGLKVMAVIWRKKDGFKVLVTPSGRPPTSDDIRLAKEYDEKLQGNLDKVTRNLKEKGFFGMKNDIKKWYILGKELQFLDSIEIRTKCDPDMKNTWRALYDLALHLAPSETVPTDRERSVGWRNHFLMCYLLGRMPWNKIKNLTWSNWREIHEAFSPEMWKDEERLLGWLIDKSSVQGKMPRRKFRLVLKALRRAVGQRARVQKDTTVLSDEELAKMLNETLAEVRGSNTN